MITKNKLWKTIRHEFKEIARSQKITTNIMERIRNLDSEDNKIRTSKDNQRRDK